MDNKHISQLNLQTIWSLSMSYEAFKYQGKVNLQFEFPSPKLEVVREWPEQGETGLLLAEVYQVDEELSFLLVEASQSEYKAFLKWLTGHTDLK